MVGVSANQHAMLWDLSIPRALDLQTLSGKQSIAMKVNNHWTVVGYSQTQGGHYSAIVWTPVVGLQGLPSLPGGGNTGAWDVNEAGDVVGDAETAAGEIHASLWRNGGGVVDLNEQIQPNSGWDLKSATGINDWGEICGFGDHNGLTRAFLLQPPYVRAQVNPWAWLATTAPFWGFILGGLDDSPGVRFGPRGPEPVPPWGPWRLQAFGGRDVLVALMAAEVGSLLRHPEDRAHVQRSALEAAGREIERLIQRIGYE